VGTEEAYGQAGLTRSQGRFPFREQERHAKKAGE
jgi:hypothetical protein